jgi:hypothetical protein
MRWARQVAHLRNMRNEYEILVGKPEAQKPLGRPRYRWQDNIKIYEETKIIEENLLVGNSTCNGQKLE